MFAERKPALQALRGQDAVGAPRPQPGQSVQFRQRLAGAAPGLVVVFLALRQGEGLRERFFRGVTLAVGELSEAEFDPMRGQFGREFDGAREVAHGLGGGGLGEPAVDHADDEARRDAERRDLVVPAAEDVVSG